MWERYSRQLLFDGIGEEGQKKLQTKHVLIIGAGALGTGNAEVLTRSGVGRLTIVDRDYVERSNLQRQQLYTDEDAINQTPKAVAAQRRLREINPDVKVEGKILDVTVEEMEQLVFDVDLIIDATDNFDTRFLINDIAQKYRIPWIYGGCVSSYGLSFTVIPGETPCLNCLLETVPLGGATCETEGVIAPAVQRVISYQTVEAMKILVEDFEAVRRKLVSFDLWNNEQSAIDVSRLIKEDCPSCGTSPIYPHLSHENQMKTAVLCGRNTVQIRPSKHVDRDLNGLVTQLEKQGGTIKQNPFLVSYYYEDRRVVFFKDGRVLIHGMKDMVEAKKIYHQLLG